MDLLRCNSSVEARNVDVVHGPERGVWDGRLVVHGILRQRRSVLIIGRHGDVDGLILLTWMIEVSGLRERLKVKERDIYRCSRVVVEAVVEKWCVRMTCWQLVDSCADTLGSLGRISRSIPLTRAQLLLLLSAWGKADGRKTGRLGGRTCRGFALVVVRVGVGVWSQTRSVLGSCGKLDIVTVLEMGLARRRLGSVRRLGELVVRCWSFTHSWVAMGELCTGGKKVTPIWLKTRKRTKALTAFPWKRGS